MNVYRVCLIFISAIQLTSSIIQDCETAPKDVVFLLDTSGSVGPSNFKLTLEAIKSFVSMFDIGPKNTRVAIETFATSVHHQLALNDYQTEASLLTAIDKIPFQSGGTQINTALAYAATYSFKNGGRLFADKVLILVTDGQSRNMNATVIQANNLQKHGINVFCLGVGAYVDIKELQAITKHRNRVFQVRDFNTLSHFIGNIRSTICKELNQVITNLIASPRTTTLRTKPQTTTRTTKKTTIRRTTPTTTSSTKSTTAISTPTKTKRTPPTTTTTKLPTTTSTTLPPLIPKTTKRTPLTTTSPPLPKTKTTTILPLPIPTTTTTLSSPKITSQTPTSKGATTTPLTLSRRVTIMPTTKNQTTGALATSPTTVAFTSLFISTTPIKTTHGIVNTQSTKDQRMTSFYLKEAFHWIEYVEVGILTLVTVVAVGSLCCFCRFCFFFMKKREDDSEERNQRRKPCKRPAGWPT